MRFLWLVILASAWTGQLLAYDDEALYAELESGEEEDILRVTNSLGEIVAEIAVFEDEEFQVVKPVESDKCYLVELSTVAEDDEQQCYQGEPLPEDEEPPLIAAECGDREPYLLVESNDCSSVVKRSDELRRKRQTDGCIKETVPVNVCVENESYCVARYGCWKGKRCKEWATRCKTYEIRYRTVVTC